MQIVTVVGGSAFERALLSAKLLHTDEMLAAGKLNAPLSAALQGRAAVVWDKIDEALRVAYNKGLQLAKPVIDEAVSALNQLIAGAGNLASEAKKFIAEKMYKFAEEFVDAALARIKTQIRIGAMDLKIKKVNISQKILLSGDLKASFEELCAMSAEGEITVEVEYGM
jgi:hypothetical protein